MRYVGRAEAAGISWLLPDGLTEAKLVEILAAREVAPVSQGRNV